MSLKLNSSGGGSVTLSEPVTASNLTLNLPAVNATVLTDSAGVLNIGSGQVYKDASGNVGIGTSSPSYKLQAQGSGGTSSAVKDTTATGTSSYANFRLEAGSTYGSILLGNGSLGVYAGANSLNIVAGDGPIAFFPNAVGSGGTERARIDSSGNLLVGNTNSTFNVSPAAVGLQVKPSGQIWPNTGYGLQDNVVCATTGTVSGSHTFISFYAGGTARGSINFNGSALTYSTSSDYRLKENVQPMVGALAKVAALKPCIYTWKDSGSAGQGFIAHELQAIVPDAVTGEKDAVDAEGNPVYQGIDTSFLVATLTAAIQEQQAMIEELKAKVAALEAK